MKTDYYIYRILSANFTSPDNMYVEVMALKISPELMHNDEIK